MPSNPATRERMLEWQFGIGTPTRPSDWYISFHTGDPGTTGANEAAELAREQQSSWAVGTPDDGQIQNATAGETATGASGAVTISHFGIWSASTAGTYYVGGALTIGRSLEIGEKLSWQIGDLTSDIT